MIDFAAEQVKARPSLAGYYGLPWWNKSRFGELLPIDNSRWINGLPFCTSEFMRKHQCRDIYCELRKSHNV